ncbi:restriction endonuclease subunit S [Bacteroides fragilis]|uniref:restriction endonuclease subunit S n=1 Tax=Bacteroides fragilis TaxID=817 RepID=UPI0022AA10BB|nr:restriction endonuclease subunit S [Bacteroides fragilis]MCE8583638.1 restriction endonuclease subunit S [Bacteroides fragilis]MCE8665237.1 restriction endonuclease subunit S [Bacteroides fragilis]MCZ2696081.1 restriction endonuclease subunit S [Bacteroides fragilis]
MNGKQLRNSILQWAIQGKLVPQDPNEEPASVLLERIRAEKAKLVKEKKIKKDKNESIIYRGDDNSYYEKFLATGEVKCIDEEIPFEIPKGWEWTRIGNIFNHTSGKQQSSSNKNGGTPQKFITTSNLYWGYFVLDNVKIMNFTEEEINNCSATKGDLLVCEGGAGYGRSAIWNYDYDICLQNHVHRLRPCVNGICEYVYHFIYLLKESNNLSSVGTAMPGLSANRLKGLLLPFPPLPEQNKIVAKLGELLPQVEKYSKVQNCLDELNVTINDKLKKSILQEAIQGKLVPQIVDEGTAQELLEQIKLEKQKLIKDGKLKKSALTDSVIYKGDDNKYFEKIGKTEQDITDEIPFDIPNTWVWVRHNDLFDISGGSQPPKSKFIEREKEGYIRLFQIRDYGSNPQPIYIPLSTASKISQKGDILLARYGASLGKVFYAEYGAYNVALAKVIPLYESRLIFQKYIFLYYCSSIYQNEIVNRSRCAQAGFNKEDLNSLLFPLPPLSEQYRIVEKYEKAIASIMRG